MPEYIITTSMPGHLPTGDPQPFEADSAGEAIEALLDEAEFMLDHDECGEEYADECTSCSDIALVGSFRAADGRGDLLHQLSTTGEASIWLDSMFNDFGATITLGEIA